MKGARWGPWPKSRKSRVEGAGKSLRTMSPVAQPPRWRRAPSPVGCVGAFGPAAASQPWWGSELMFVEESRSLPN
jgi:hypothetical protein